MPELLRVAGIMRWAANKRDKQTNKQIACPEHGQGLHGKALWKRDHQPNAPGHKWPHRAAINNWEKRICHEGLYLIKY